MRDRLRLKGHKVNRKRVKRLMNLMGIQSLAPQKKKTTIPAPGHKIYPYLLRNLDIVRPDQLSVSPNRKLASRQTNVFRDGRVCLDSRLRFISDKLPPAHAAVSPASVAQ